MQKIAHLTAQEKPLVTTGHSWPLEGFTIVLNDDLKQFQTSFEVGIPSDLTIKCLTLKCKPINIWLLTCNYTQNIPTLPSTCWNLWRWLVLLMYVTIWGQCATISWTTRNAVDNSNITSSSACKMQKNHSAAVLLGQPHGSITNTYHSEILCWLNPAFIKESIQTQ